MLCAACGNTMTHLVDDLHICSDCTLISSHTMPDKSIYDKSYVLKYQRYERSETGEAIQKLRWDTVNRHVKKGRLLDYGCGVGSFVKYCNFNGVVSHGFDVNPYGDYCDPTILLEPYDVITFWDSLEHIENPATMLKRLNAPYVFICTPSTDDFGGRKSELPSWRHYMPEEHVHYFNAKSLRQLLETCGYDVIEQHYDESKLRKGGGDKNIITMGGKWAK